MNQVDNFQRTMRVAQRRKWAVIVSLSVILCLIIVFFVWQKIEQNKETARLNAYLEIEGLHQSENKKYSLELQKNKESETFDFAKAAGPDHTESAKKFAEFALNYPTDPIAWQAALKASAYYIEAKNLDQAKAILVPLLEKNSNLPYLVQFPLRRALAGILCDENNYAEALAQLAVLENNRMNPIPGELKIFKAQIHFLAGNKEEAKKQLQQVIAEDKDSPEDSESFLASESAAKKAKMWLGFWNLQD